MIDDQSVENAMVSAVRYHSRSPFDRAHMILYYFNRSYFSILYIFDI